MISPVTINSVHSKVFPFKENNPTVSFGTNTLVKSPDYDIFVCPTCPKDSPPYPMEKLGETFYKPIKLFFSDIDDTIRRSDTRTIPESALEAIGKLKKEGIPLIYATGRCITELKHIEDELPTKPDYYILEQGTQIVDKNYNIIYEDLMSAEDTRKVVKFYEKFKNQDPNVHLLVYFDGIPYTTSKPENIPGNKRDFTKTVDSFDELLNNGFRPTKIVFFKKGSKTYEDLEPLRSAVVKNLKNTALTSVLATTKYCEVFNKTSSKGNAIKTIAGWLDTKIENTAAIGDSGNDLDMVSMVKNAGGLGIAMGNGMDTLKENAGYVTADIRDDGFAFAVNQIIENNRRFC